MVGAGFRIPANCRAAFYSLGLLLFLPMRADALAKVTGGPVGKQTTSYNESPPPPNSKTLWGGFLASILPVQ